ncbi:hypothetical protein LEMLEM_LOCUS4220 [Lemmus lemmus]
MHKASGHAEKLESGPVCSGGTPMHPPGSLQLAGQLSTHHPGMAFQCGGRSGCGRVLLDGSGI